MRCSKLRCTFLAIGALLMTTAADRSESLAGDWPQILGPNRNGVADGEKLPDQWPAEGVKPAWTYPLGQGYAGPAVAGDRVIVFHRVGNNERVEALDRATGKSLWKADLDTAYRSGIDPDAGPRCVPLIHKQSVYVLGASGTLRSVALADGKLNWSRNLLEDYRGDEGYFGAGSTPVIAGDRLLVNVGGKQDAGLVALALDSGKTLWQATDEGASYAAPTVAKVQGKELAIFATRLNCVGVAPQDGSVQFRVPFGKRGPTVNAATPLVFNQQLFLSASYGIGAFLYQLDGRSPKSIWSNDDTLSSQYATAVFREGHLYGTHGREDYSAEGRQAQLRCVAAESGKVMWSEPDFGVAHVLLAGDKLLIVKVRGPVLLAKASPEGFKVLGKATVTRGQEATRALPALSQGSLVVRTNDGREGGRLISIPVQ